MERPPTPPPGPRSVSRRSFLGLLAAAGVSLAGCVRSAETTQSPAATAPPTAATLAPNAESAPQPAPPVAISGSSVECDVCVVGGGAAGMAAATTAAANGARTVLLEESSILGGNITRGLVNIDRIAYGGDVMVRGYFHKLLTRMIAAHRAIEPDVTNNYAVIYDTDYLRQLALHLARQAGVTVMLATAFVSAQVAEGRLTSVEAARAGEHITIKSHVYIDCTGDGNLGFAAGCDFWQGDHTYHQIQGQTLMFHVDGVDFQAASQYQLTKESANAKNLANEFQLVGFRDFMKRFRMTHKRLGDPQRGILMTRTMNPTVFCVSASEIYGNHLAGPSSLADITDSLQQQDYAIHDSLRREVPGFKDSSIVRLAERPYLREGRRLQGLYQLTSDDVQAARKAPDGIARGWYPIDLHVAYAGGPIQLPGPGYRRWYDIPYRCLVSRNIPNLLMAGRCISVTHEALGSTRVSALSMALGQAAGVAAAQAVRSRKTPAELPAAALRKELKRQGALV